MSVRFASRLALMAAIATPIAVFGVRGIAQQAQQRDVATPPPAGTAIISGIVVSDDKTPAPVRRARVTVRSEAYGNGWSATTDDDGRFVVRGVAAGRFTVQAAKPAWLTSNYGAARPGRPGTPVVVTEGARVDGLTIRMSRGAVVTGTVADRSGQPMPGVTVSAMRYTFSEITGEKTLLRAGGADSVSDDQGAYRLYGLSPGEYLVVATFRSGAPTALMDLQRVTEADVRRALADAKAPPAAPQPSAAPAATPAGGLVGFAPVFHPNTPDVGRATPLMLAAGEERGGINIAMDPVPTARVDVAVRVPDTANAGSLQVYLVANQANATSLAVGRRDAGGQWNYTGVTPGAYTVFARAAAVGAVGAAPPSGRGRGGAAPLTFYAISEVAVDGRDVVVALELREGMTVSGKVVFDDVARAPADPGISASLIAFASVPALSVGSAPADASGAFTFKGVPAGRYRLEYSAARVTDNWVLASAVAQGRNVLDSVLDVRAGEDVTDLVLTFSNRVSELSGRLQSASGQPAPNYYIIAFPTEQAYWLPRSRRVRQMRPAADGGFSVRGLPAGEYYLAALTDVELGQWYDAAFLAQLVPSAAKVTIREGQRTIQDLQIK